MPGELTKIWFAAVVAVASLPALAAEMPDSGTKNFIPAGDAPSYFTNESGGISSTAAADQTASDDGVDQTLGSPRSETGSMRSAKTTTRRHGRLVASREGERRSAASVTAGGRSAHFAGARRTKTASVGTAARPIRSANPSKTNSVRAGVARPAKSSARHAAAKSATRRG
jgi:hypothetical protein